MLRYLLFLALFFIKTLDTQGQNSINLIPNPSFEDINICHKYVEPCSPSAWRSTVLKNVRYPTYDPGDENFFKPAEGVRCIAFGVYNERKKNDRSFIQVPLLCQLKKGEQYKLSLAFRPNRVMINTFGVYFADTLVIHDKNETVLALEPQIKFTFDKKIMPRQWQKVEAIYTASGDEKGIILGNFNTDETTEFQLLEKRKKGYRSRRVYYAFDDIRLEPLDTKNVDCDIKVNQDFIYQDSFRHIDKYGIALISQVSQMDSLSFYKRPKPKKIVPKPDKILLEDTEIKVNEAFVASDINFSTNSDKLLPSSLPTLQTIAQFLKKNEIFRLKIIGHTDEVGDEFANQKLSEDRAKAVVRFLMQQGISPKRLLSLGRGESEPIGDNWSEQGRRMNRRVEFVIY